MEEVKNKEVAEEVTQEEPQVGAVEEQVPELDLEKFQSKDDPEITKVDLSKPIETVDENQTDLEEAIEEVSQEEVASNEAPALEEIT